MTVPVTIRFTTEQVEVLEYLAKVQGVRSRGDLVRAAVERQIDFESLQERAHFYFEERARMDERAMEASINHAEREAEATVDA